MAKTNGMWQFFILLYKGLLLRKRHYIVTFFEIIIPIFIASIPAIIQSEMSSSDIHFTDNSTSLWLNASFYEPFDPFVSLMDKKYDLEFVYTPPNAASDKLVKDSIGMFKRRAEYKGNITMKSATTEYDLEMYCLYKQRANPSLIMIGTVFNNFAKTLPESLDYKIRYGGLDFGGSFFTQLKYRVNGPQTRNEYNSTFFLSWQAAVEESFIQEKMTEKGKNIDYKVWMERSKAYGHTKTFTVINIIPWVWMQRFPYPKHRDTNKTFTVINIIPWVIGYGYLIFIMNIVRRVIEEKTNKSKELMKMMGMTDCVYWTSTFFNYFLVAIITMLVTTIIYKAPLKNAFVFVKNMDFMLLFFMLTLFMACLILFCMAFSIFFTRSVLAVVALIMVHILSFTLLMSNYFILNVELNYLPLSFMKKLGICLLPSGSLLTMFTIISFYESTGEGAQWYNLTEYTLIPDMNMLIIIIMMIVSSIIYIIIIWYFDAVWPWQPGVPKPFYFPFTKSYWCGVKSKDFDELLLANQNDNSADFFEEEPNGATPGVIIRNLSKEFRTGLQTKLAVNNVSLNIYQGQITALLGHNGAGKTTTINILTGLYTPSSGSAAINGLDILSDTIKARRSLGVCPQDNVLYDTLTVEEHLKIYAALKGINFRNLTDEASSVLGILKLEDKRHELVKSLSGGMKRKLSLGIAIVGGSKVLFLDEPTSGMDVEARRSVWDALLDIRHDRTIILTTHYMEEADILGDRIAIMAEGEVQCCGSPIFLKQKFGTGYHLHVVKGKDFDVKGLTKVLEKYIPEVSVGNELDQEISFNLSSDSSTEFGKMFEDMEEHKNELGVQSYGITITTMEDVFLNVANISDMKYKLQGGNESINGSTIVFEDVYGNSNDTKNRNLVNQFFGLLLKRFHYSKRHYSILVSQLILPFILICWCLSSIHGGSSQYKTTYDPLKLDIASEYGTTDGFYFSRNDHYSDMAKTFKNVLESNNVNVKSVLDPTQYILKYGLADISNYLKILLVGGTFDGYPDGTLNLTAWFNGEPYHTTPMSLLLMHTALLKNISGPGATITLTNAPLPQPTLHVKDDSTRMLERILAGIFMPLALAYLSGSFVMIPIQERTSKAKLLQLMSGVPAAMYWLAMFLWDFMVFVSVSILLVIPFAIFSHYVFFSPHSEAIGTALLLMVLYGWASIPFSYLMSFLFKKGNSGFSAVVGICTLFGVGLGTSLRTLQFTFAQTPIEDLDNAFWFLRILPTFCLSVGFSNLFGISYNNAFCESVSKEDLAFNCNSTTIEVWNPLYKCCKNICGSACLQEVNPITFDKDGCGPDILYLAIDGAIYFSILLLLETRLMASFGRLLKQAIQKLRRNAISEVTKDLASEDSEVLAEEERIRNMLATGSGDTGGEALVVSELTKVYKNFYAVDHLTFGIHQEECFGLLGVNGAGKTTTFRMLTGDCHPTEGNAMIGNVSVMTDLKKFQSNLGYCPQFDALIDKLTGREMLQLFARLRGLSGPEMEERVNQMIKMTDLTAHADKQTHVYSGGNKRKLSVGIALIGSPPLLLLDEPTAGVDPVSRRKIWNILSQARNNTGAAVILTTHSMEESEALCSRLAIMVNGRFRCLGSIQQLKSKYGQGYTLIIKLKREDQHDYQAMNAVKAHVEGNMKGAQLKDDHQGMLQYHIIDPTVTLSRLFKFMSTTKTEFELEDYLISDTSLEQIFLTFARSQRITA